jgi:putative spermidine/putrescine transport system substrate-binding protein
MKKLALACAIGVALSISHAAAEETVGYASYGGAYQQAVRKAFLDPITADHGIKIRDYSLQGGLPEVRAQVAAGAVQWDIVELYAGQCQQAANEGLLEPLDYNVIKNTGGIPKHLVADHWVGFTAYSTVLAYNKEVYGDNPPKSWADFFDVEKFPGTRALGGVAPSANMEIALLAAGKKKEEIYPIDFDLAFKKLGELKPKISVWWGTGAQAAQLAQSQEVDMLAIWAARIDAVIKEGAPYAYTLNQGVIDVECLIVPKGAPNKEAAMKVINHLIAPEYQANLPKYIPYGPINQDAFKTGKITPDQAEYIVTSEKNLPLQIIIDKPFWAENGQKAQEMWDKFMQQ